MVRIILTVRKSMGAISSEKNDSIKSYPDDSLRLVWMNVQQSIISCLRACITISIRMRKIVKLKNQRESSKRGGDFAWGRALEPHRFSGGTTSTYWDYVPRSLQPDLVIADGAISALDVSVHLSSGAAQEVPKKELGWLPLYRRGPFHFWPPIAVIYKGTIVEVAETEKNSATIHLISPLLSCCSYSRLLERKKVLGFMIKPTRLFCRCEVRQDTSFGVTGAKGETYLCRTK